MNRFSQLGYTHLWLELGLLSEHQLDEQWATFKKSDDKNTEHYRYETFRNYLTTRKVLTDQELDNYLQVAYSEKDEPMASCAIIDILREIELTALQFDHVCSAIEGLGLGNSSQKIISHQKRLRKLKSGQLTDELFAESLHDGDSLAQRYLLNLADKHQLQQLVENGATKAIKNTAREKLNQLK
jgi:hypothetical protein